MSRRAVGPSFSNPATLCVGLLLVLFVSGCECAGPDAGSCRTASDCSRGQICVDNMCRPGGSLDGGLPDAEPIDVGPLPDRYIPPAEDAGPCREVTGESTVEPVPVDIIIAIDNSGSMSEEATQVRENVNRFAAIIEASGLDYRVVLISIHTGSRGVCVPGPLGEGPPGCMSGPDGRLLALHVTVASRNAPQLVLNNYPMYRDFLRPEAAKVFLWITDDESNTHTADEFRTALAALDPPGMFDNQIHNAIVGFYGDTPETWGTASAGACGSLARVGTTYLRLTNCLDDSNMPIADCRSGTQARVCETDWTTLLEEIAMGVVAGVPVVCDFAIPEPPMGMTLDFEEIGVVYVVGDMSETALTRVAEMSACVGGGWYFDDAAAPTQIILCPDTCRTVQADPDARIDIRLGCFPILM